MNRRRRNAITAMKSMSARRRARKNNPSVSAVHVNRPLTNIAIAFLQDPGIFFSPQIFPVVPVRKKSDSYFTWDRGDLNRDSAQAVGPGAAYPIGEKTISETDYNCRVYKYSELVADEERENSDEPLQLDTMATRSVMQKFAIRRDRQWAADFFTTGVWTGSTTGTDLTPAVDWDHANGTWIEDVRVQVRSLTKKGLARSGMTLTLAPAVFDAIIDHSTTLDRIQSMNSGKMLSDPSEADLAAILRIGRVIVGESVYNSANVGATTVDAFTLGDDGALLTYAPSAPALNEPSAGYTMSWTGLGGAGAAISRLRRDDRDADQIKGRAAFAQVKTSAECGAFFDSVLA